MTYSILERLSLLDFQNSFSPVLCRETRPSEEKRQLQRIVALDPKRRFVEREGRTNPRLDPREGMRDVLPGKIEDV